MIYTKCSCYRPTLVQLRLIAECQLEISQRSKGSSPHLWKPDVQLSVTLVVRSMAHVSQDNLGGNPIRSSTLFL